jgi:hypothetical protein
MSFATSIKRAAATLSLAGIVGAAALGSGVAHAAGPQIAVQTQQFASVLHVTGSGFGAGDSVIVYAVNNDTHKVETSATTTASRPMPICLLPSGRCTILPGGAINVSTPPDYIHCGYAFVTVYAIDQKTLAHSNYVQATLGLGPC